MREGLRLQRGRRYRGDNVFRSFSQQVNDERSVVDVVRMKRNEICRKCG